MGALLAIATKDLRQRFRDRSAILVAIVAPLVLATIFSLIGGDSNLNGRYLVVDQDGGAVAVAFRETLLADVVDQGLASAETVGSWDGAVMQVDDGDADAAFRFPAGLSDSLGSASPGTIEVVTSDQETYETLLAGALANRFADGVDLVRVAGATSSPAGRPTSAAAGPVSSADDPVELRQLGLETYYVAGIAAFFVFFTVQFGLITFQSERRDGTLTRMLAAPIRPAAILAGKGLVSLILAVVSVSVVVIASIPLLGTEWGSPLGVAMMVIALSIAAVGTMAAATVLVRTYDQANGLSMVIAVVLGLLGGSFFPVFLGPELLQSLAVISPHRWWLLGLGDLAPSSASATDALPAAGALVAYGLGFGALAAFRAQRMLAP